MWTCNHCKKEYDLDSVSDRGNHSRWCISNPKRNNWQKFTSADRKYGKKVKFTVSCTTCSMNMIVIEREKLHPKKSEYFCTRSCANSKGGKAKVQKYGITSYYAIAKKFYKEECAICGITDVLDVHHIDENRSNNKKENLIFLCPNDHARVHRIKDIKIIDTIRGIGDRR